MADSDRELQRLEYAFQICLHALKTEMPPHLIERLTSLARRQALTYASEQSGLQPGVPQSERALLQQIMRRSAQKPPPRTPSKTIRPKGKFDDRQMEIDAFESAPSPARSEEMSPAVEAEIPSDTRGFGDQFSDRTSIDVARLRGRNRETWLQRIAELTLQGETGRAEELLAAYNRQVG